jgi:hypothetical protein
MLGSVTGPSHGAYTRRPLGFWLAFQGWRVAACSMGAPSWS